MQTRCFLALFIEEAGFSVSQCLTVLASWGQDGMSAGGAAAGAAAQGTGRTWGCVGNAAYWTF